MSKYYPQPTLPLFEESEVPAVSLSFEASSIRGLSYLPDFISEEVHDKLLQNIDRQPWLDDLKRRVQHYGYKYDYRARSVDQSMRIGELPGWAQDIGRDLVAARLMDQLPDQLIVNEYEPGQGISNHVDCEPCFGGVIASLSLGSPCVMNFTDRREGTVVPVLLQPRSLVVLADDARYAWMHGIPARKSDIYAGTSLVRSRRVSLTFRRVVLNRPAR